MKTKFIISVLILPTLYLFACSSIQDLEDSFSGESAYSFVETQMSFGPRYPGSEGHKSEQEWIQEELSKFGWHAETQATEYLGKEVTNILATRNPGSGEALIIIGAHYDTRMVADRSEEFANQSQPVPGANDGASGVAVLLELARVLPDFRSLDVQLVFFDAEDNGYLPGWDWIIGSTYFAEQLESLPEAVVIVDMIGDVHQEIYYEKSSDPQLKAEIWGIAEQNNVSTFIPEENYHILDDHTSFIGRGIPAVLLIDFDYEYWHTTEDTLDKISGTSLENVGQILLDWLYLRDSQIE